MKNIILIAAPAAGKGTLSELLVEKYQYAHISTGDLLRSMDKTTEVGQKVDALLKEGKLIPDDIVFSLLEKRLEEKDCLNGYILDGFPRTLEQAKLYDSLLEKLGRELGIVVVLTTDVEILKQRIVGRLLCKDCGSVYNTLTGVNQPKQENTCDKCGGELYKRSDDNEESFKVRYESYLEKTQPLIDYYQSKNQLFFIDSSNKENMLKEIEGLLHD